MRYSAECSGLFFPVKLHYMLEELEKDGKDDIASWDKQGRHFVVHKQQEFVKDVLPLWFRQSTFASFQRQLNLYGFRRIKHGDNKGGYYHKLFLRAKPFLAQSIERNSVKTALARRPAPPEKEISPTARRPFPPASPRRSFPPRSPPSGLLPPSPGCSMMNCTPHGQLHCLPHSPPSLTAVDDGGANLFPHSPNSVMMDAGSSNCMGAGGGPGVGCMQSTHTTLPSLMRPSREPSLIRANREALLEMYLSQNGHPVDIGGGRTMGSSRMGMNGVAPPIYMGAEHQRMRPPMYPPASLPPFSRRWSRYPRASMIASSSSSSALSPSSSVFGDRIKRESNLPSTTENDATMQEERVLDASHQLLKLKGEHPPPPPPSYEAV